MTSPGVTRTPHPAAHNVICRYEELVVKGKLLAEDDIIFQNTDVHKLQPVSGGW
jgi:hypothetical protein